jgi:cytochrome c-type biogenesis protein
LIKATFMLEVSIVWAGVAGLLSFLTPCVLPIVPFYLSYLAGVGMDSLAADGPIDPKVRRRAVIAAICFSAGVIAVFMAFGATASIFGQVFREWFDVLRWIAAIIIIAMGLHFLGVVRIGILYRQLRADVGDTSNVSYLGAFVIGLAFAFGWTPCVGPVLAAILFTAAGTETAAHGVLLLFVYGLGMTLPFVIAALFVGPFLRWMQGFRRHLGKIEKVMGAMLVLFGILIATETVNIIANWMVLYWPRLG